MMWQWSAPQSVVDLQFEVWFCALFQHSWTTSFLLYFEPTFVISSSVYVSLVCMCVWSAATRGVIPRHERFPIAVYYHLVYSACRCVVAPQGRADGTFYGPGSLAIATSSLAAAIVKAMTTLPRMDAFKLRCNFGGFKIEASFSFVAGSCDSLVDRMITWTQNTSFACLCHPVGFLVIMHCCLLVALYFVMKFAAWSTSVTACEIWDLPT